jgi:hypothetical protein
MKLLYIYLFHERHTKSHFGLPNDAFWSKAVLTGVAKTGQEEVSWWKSRAVTEMSFRWSLIASVQLIILISLVMGMKHRG